MDANQLRANLQALEGRVQRAGSALQAARMEYETAQALATQAHAAIAALSAVDDDDSGERSALEQYYAMAADAEARANEARRRRQAAAGELSTCVAEYVSYRAQGTEAVSALQQAAGQLGSLAAGKYGAAAFQAALGTAGQRLTFYQNLIRGCEERISRIERILSEG